ncbi:MAG: hypothetical protein ACO3GZ_09865 [Ilumatobacteraceae bacterium]
MGRNGVHLVREWPNEPQVRAWLTTPHDDLVREEADARRKAALPPPVDRPVTERPST